MNYQQLEKIFFENNIIPSLEVLKPLNKYAHWNILFQKEYTQEDIDRYAEIFKLNGFEMYGKIKSYSFPYGLNSLSRIREDCHSIHPECDYILAIDDDMKFIDSKYCNAVLASIYWMDRNNEIGSVSIESTYKRFHYDLRTDRLRKCTNRVHHYWCDGGQLLKNIPEFEGAQPEKYRDLIGSGQDELFVDMRNEIGLVAYRTISPYYQHYEIGEQKGPSTWGWLEGDSEQNSCVVQLRRIRDLIARTYSKIPEKQFYFGDYSFEEIEKLFENL